MRRKQSRLYVDKSVAQKLKEEAARANMTLKDYLAYKLGTDSNETKKRFKGIF